MLKLLGQICLEVSTFGMAHSKMFSPRCPATGINHDVCCTGSLFVLSALGVWVSVWLSVCMSVCPRSKSFPLHLRGPNIVQPKG